MIDDVMLVLEADSTLMDYMTGGIYSQTEITRQGTPDAFDANLEIMPCALVNQGSQAQSGPYVENGISAQLYLRVYFYELSGYASIGPAVERVRELLHRQKIGDNVWEVAWVNDTQNLRDQALDCSLAISTYQVTRLL